jgi:hypothetical protein
VWGCFQGVDSDRLLDVLDLLWPKVREGERNSLSHVPIGCFRDTDASWISDALQPCSNIHSIPKQVASRHDDITDMYPDSELEVLPLGSVIIGGRQLILHLGSASDGINGTGEFGQHTVTSGIGDPSAIFDNQSIHDLAVCSQATEGSSLILLYQPRVACHVSRKESYQPPLDLMLLRTHQPLGVDPN